MPRPTAMYMSPLGLLVLTLLTAAPVSAQEYLEQIHSQFDFMEEVMAAEGFQPDLRRETGAQESGNTHVFSVSLREGVSYRMIGVCDTDCQDVDLVLYDEGGEQLTEDVLADDVPIVAWTPSTTGTYVVEVTMVDCAVEPCYWGVQPYSTEGATGPVTAEEPVAPLASEGMLERGDATLQSGEYVDELTFEAQSGERVQVDLRSSDFDTYVMLLGPGDFRVENDDADDDVGHSRIEADLSEAGTYRVLVTSYAPAETGRYALDVARGPTRASSDGPAMQTLELGGTATGLLEPGDGALESGEFRDLWLFEAEAGQDLTIELTSADFDTYAMLIAPDGSVVDENDDVDGRTDLSRIDARLSAAGQYRVMATSYAPGEAGRYEVTVRPARAATGVSGGPGRTGVEAAPGPNGQVFGVFVGVSDYGGRANDLAYTADDAHRAADALVAGGGMDRSNAIVLTDREATVANVREAFAEMGQRVGPDDTFVYFYSGHGARAQRSGPEHSDPDALDETIELFDAAIRDNEMSDLLDLIDSSVSLLVLDACFSGGFSKDVISVPGRMGFFSSEEDVTSQVASKFRAGGYLAQFVFDGVGERHADSDRDGAISAIELSQYIHERYRSDVKSGGPDDYVRTGGPQTGFQHFVADRGSISPDRVLFR